MIRRIAMAGHGGYAPESLTLFARMTTPPSTSRKRLIDNLIRFLLAQGIWPKLDGLWLMAAADSQAACLNWVGTSFTLAPVSAPVFTADRGFQSAVGGYLTTGMSGSTYTLVAGGVWANVAGSSGLAMGSFNSGGTIGLAPSGFDARARSAPHTISPGTGLGYFAASRANSLNWLQAEGAAQTTITEADSGSGGTDDITLLASQNNFGTITDFYDGRLGAAHVGPGLTAGDLANMNLGLNAYLTGVGGA